MIRAETCCFFSISASYPINGKSILTASRFYFNDDLDGSGDFRHDSDVWNPDLLMNDEWQGAGSNMRGVVNPYVRGNPFTWIAYDLSDGGMVYSREGIAAFPHTNTQKHDVHQPQFQVKDWIRPAENHQ